MNNSDLQLANYVRYLRTVVNNYFAYTVLSIAFVSQIVALAVLFIRRPKESTLMIYLLKWQYVLGTLYVLNIGLIESRITPFIWRYSRTQNVSDFGCKILNLMENLFYCLTPWMQVVSFRSNYYSISLNMVNSISKYATTTTTNIF